MCKIAEIIMAVLLALIGYKDWKTKQISGSLLIGMTIAAILLRIFVMKGSWQALALGIAIGFLFFVISKCSREAIGYGDSWLILILGIFVGGMTLVKIVFTGMFLAGIFSLLYCIRNGWKKNQALPFVPFLTAAYMGVMFF